MELYPVFQLFGVNVSIVLCERSFPLHSFDCTLELLAPLNNGESRKFEPLVGELGHMFASTEGSIVVASSCWQLNMPLSRLACDCFLRERTLPFSGMLS